MAKGKILQGQEKSQWILFWVQENLHLEKSQGKLTVVNYDTTDLIWLKSGKSIWCHYYQNLNNIIQEGTVFENMSTAMYGEATILDILYYLVREK